LKVDKVVMNINDSNDRRFKTSGEAKKELQTSFDKWSSILTTHSIQIAFAIIAANWAVHGSASAILSNDWSKGSLVIILGFLGLDLLITRLITWLLYKRILYAEKNVDRWNKEYIKAKGKRYWPFTKSIEYIGLAFRELKVWAPILAAIFFIISLFLY